MVAAGALIPVSGVAWVQEPAGPLGGSFAGQGISKLPIPLPLIPPIAPLLSLPSLMTQDFRDLDC